MNVDGSNDVVGRPDGSSVDKVIVGVVVILPDLDELAVLTDGDAFPEEDVVVGGLDDGGLSGDDGLFDPPPGFSPVSAG